MNEHRSTLIVEGSGLTIISGGQTGVDRAALDAALQLEIPVAGWCPGGRRAEDGRIPDEYPLQETASWNYAERTEWNVRDSDGTLIIVMDTVSGGTKLTARLARRYGRPLQIVRLLEDLADAAAENPHTRSVETVVEWIMSRKIRVLNVAGPRGTSDERMYPQARQFCEKVFAALMSSPAES